MIDVHQPGSAPMRHVSIITLGVADLAAATTFYESLGWHQPAPSDDPIVFLEHGAVVLALFGDDDLAADAGLRAEPLPAYRGLTLATNLPSTAEVDALVERAVAAGATVVKSPERTDWGGYSGYLADLDGHLWEVAHNPFFPLDADGRVRITG
jgi:uncharacterized protein